MAALTDETRQTLAEIDRKSREQGEKFSSQVSEAARALRDAAAAEQAAADQLSRAGQRLEVIHYVMTVTVGILSAGLVIGLWLLLAPPSIVNNQLDAEAVAQYLKPAVIEALKPSGGKHKP